jgi:DNA-binding transcriptional regulator GbsR (MarR family)
LSSVILRREFLLTLGAAYSQYGYPEYCGWVEGLLLLEPQEWTQHGISERLSEILPEPQYPTSVPSVNRALRLLKSYGIVKRQGSRKSGYLYHVVDSASVAASMVEQLAAINTQFIHGMEDLRDRNKEKDTLLDRALNAEIRMARMWDEVLGALLTPDLFRVEEEGE